MGCEAIRRGFGLERREWRERRGEGRVENEWVNGLMDRRFKPNLMHVIDRMDDAMRDPDSNPHPY